MSTCSVERSVRGYVLSSTAFAAQQGAQGQHTLHTCPHQVRAFGASGISAKKKTGHSHRRRETVASSSLARGGSCGMPDLRMVKIRTDGGSEWRGTFKTRIEAQQAAHPGMYTDTMTSGSRASGNSAAERTTTSVRRIIGAHYRSATRPNGTPTEYCKETADITGLSFCKNTRTGTTTTSTELSVPSLLARLQVTRRTSS